MQIVHIPTGIDNETVEFEEWNPDTFQPGATKVSVYCITHNHAPYIEEALKGFLMQKTEFAFEVIVVDDASTDGTHEILKRYAKEYPQVFHLLLARKNYFHHPRRQNINAYLEKNFFHAPYIALCEGDDYWTSAQKLQRQVEFLDTHPDFSGSTHNVRCVDEKGELHHGNYMAYAIRDDYIYTVKNAYGYEMAGQLASLVYRNGYGMMQQVELYEQYPSFAFNDDIMMQTELLFHGPVYAFHEIMADHRRVFDHGESYTAWAHGKNLQWRTYCIFRDIASVIALEGFDASGFHLDLDGCYQSAMRTYLENPTEENKMVVDQFENEIRDTKKIALYRKKAEEEYARQRLPDQADPYRKIADKNTAIARLLYVWMIGNGHGGSVAAALKEKGFHEVVIYGVALLGTRLAEELKHTDISVLYCIDQRKYGLPDEVQTFAMGELEEGVFKIPDAVIVTAFSEFEHIKQSLLEKGFQNVICVDELIYSLLQN